MQITAYSGIKIHPRDLVLERCGSECAREYHIMGRISPLEQSEIAHNSVEVVFEPFSFPFSAMLYFWMTIRVIIIITSKFTLVKVRKKRQPFLTQNSRNFISAVEIRDSVSKPLNKNFPIA